MANRKVFNILAILFGVLPPYLYVFVDKLSADASYSESSLLYIYFLISLFAIIVILGLDKAILNTQLIKISIPKKSYLHITIWSFLILISTYVTESFTSILFYRIFQLDVTRNEAIINTIIGIFQNPFKALFFIGPVILSGQLFLELSRVYLLENLSKLSASKYWQIIIIVLTSIFISLISIDNGITGIIFSFLVSLIFNWYYLKFRYIIPILVASILYQLIPLILFWIQQ